MTFINVANLLLYIFNYNKNIVLLLFIIKTTISNNFYLLPKKYSFFKLLKKKNLLNKVKKINYERFLETLLFLLNQYLNASHIVILFIFFSF